MHKRRLLRGFNHDISTKTSVIVDEIKKFVFETVVLSSNACDVFRKLKNLVDELIFIQQKFTFVRSLKNNESRCDLLETYSVENTGFIQQDIKFEFADYFGCGLFAASVIPENSCILRIPRKAMLDARSSPSYSEVIANDPIASKMENVALSICVLCELSRKSSSPWYNYIRSLPMEYSTCLYMNEDELLHLKGSTALEKCVRDFLFNCRQYAYFFDRFQCLKSTVNLPFLSTFCFEDYRWAVSTVMSRNNLVPCGSTKMICLIPLWDMVNHKTGRLCTDFDTDTEDLVFYAIESYQPGEQIFMDYGKRSSAEFLLYSGFVPQTNPHNYVIVTLGLGKSDPLASKRRLLLELLGLCSPLVCHLYGGWSSLLHAFAFARVFEMSDSDLMEVLPVNPSNIARTDASLVGRILTPPPDPEAVLDAKASNFLITRLELLIRAYGHVCSEEDPSFDTLTLVQRNCHCLKRQEIGILQNSISCLRDVMKPQPIENLSNQFVFIST